MNPSLKSSQKGGLKEFGEKVAPPYRSIELPNLSRVAEWQDEIPWQPFVDGAEFPLFGEPHRIRHRPDQRGTVWREGSVIHVAGHPEHLPRRLRDWLIAELRCHLVPLVCAKAARVGRPVKRITIRDNRSRWGSCGPNATMTFSWRLVFAPRDVVDYLVAHEVAHLVHLNHGPRFWALARELSDGPMEAADLWLKRNSELLLQYGA